MVKIRYKKDILISIILLIFSAFSLNGCMEAGAEDWVGERYVEEEPSEEPSTEEPTVEAVGEVSGGDKEVENELPTYAPEYPEEEEEEFEEEEEEIEEEPEEEVSDNSVSEDDIDDSYDEENNHDVTRGTWSGDDWTAEATIGEDYSISVTVTSTREAMKQEKVTDYSPAGKQMGDNIKDIRFSFYKKVEGNKSDAADDVEDFEDIDKMTKKQMESLMAISDDLGKLIRQFGITGYDFDKPAENDDTDITLDLYRGNKFQYFMYLVFDDDGKLTEVEFELQEY